MTERHQIAALAAALIVTSTATATATATATTTTTTATATATATAAAAAAATATATATTTAAATAAAGPSLAATATSTAGPSSAASPSANASGAADIVAASGVPAIAAAGASSLPSAASGEAAPAGAGQAAASGEADVLARLTQMRAMQAPANAVAAREQNHTLDNAWRFFGDNKPTALHVLRRELAAELRKPQPNQLILLDIGFFLARLGEPGDKALSMQALRTIDADAPLIKASSEQLFRFAHLTAADHDERLFPLLDKAFLHGKVTVFVPQHGFTVDEATTAALIYGQYGAKGEAHLRGLLGDSTIRNKVLEVLIAIGSPDSVPAVAALLQSEDPDTFVRAVTFLARTGGPQGRDALTAFDAKALQGKSREYFAQVSPRLKGLVFESMRGERSEQPISDEEVRRRLESLYERYGEHEDLQASDILYSTLPKQFLIDQLTRIRERTLLRVSDEALADLEMTNTVLNTLRYRPD